MCLVNVNGRHPSPNMILTGGRKACRSRVSMAVVRMAPVIDRVAIHCIFSSLRTNLSEPLALPPSSSSLWIEVYQTSTAYVICMTATDLNSCLMRLEVLSWGDDHAPQAESRSCCWDCLSWLSRVRVSSSGEVDYRELARFELGMMCPCPVVTAFWPLHHID